MSTLKNIVTNELRIDSHVFYSSGTDIYVRDIRTTNLPYKISSQVSSGTNISSVVNTGNEIVFNYTDGRVTRTADFHNTFLEKTAGIGQISNVTLHDNDNGIVVWENSMLKKGQYATKAEQGNNNLVTSDLLFNVSQSFFNINELNVNLANNGGEYDPPVAAWDGTKWVGKVLSIGELLDVTVPENIQNESILYWNNDRFMVKSISSYNYIRNSDLVNELVNYVKVDGTNTEGGNNKVLLWDANLSKWKGQEMNMSNLKDVTITGIANNSILLYRNNTFSNHVVKSTLDLTDDIVSSRAIKNELQKYLNIEDSQNANINDYIRWSGTKWEVETPSNTNTEVVNGTTELVTSNGVRQYIANLTGDFLINDGNKYAYVSDIKSYVSQEINLFKSTYMDYLYTNATTQQNDNTTLTELFRSIVNLQDTNNDHIIVKRAGNTDTLLTDKTVFTVKTVSSLIDDVKNSVGSGILELKVDGTKLKYDTVNVSNVTVKDYQGNDMNVVAFEDTILQDDYIYYIEYDSVTQKLAPKELTQFNKQLININAASGTFTILNSQSEINAFNIDSTGDLKVSGNTELNGLDVSGVTTINNTIDVNSTINITDEMYIKKLELSNGSSYINESGSGLFNSIEVTNNANVLGELEVGTNIKGDKVIADNIQISTLSGEASNIGTVNVNNAIIQDLEVTNQINISQIEFVTGDITTQDIRCSGNMTLTEAGKKATINEIESQIISATDTITTGKLEVDVLSLSISGNNSASLNTDGELTVLATNDYESVYRSLTIVPNSQSYLSKIKFMYNLKLGTQTSLIFTNNTGNVFTINSHIFEIYENNVKQKVYTNYGKLISIAQNETTLINILKLNSGTFANEVEYFVNFVKYNLASEP